MLILNPLEASERSVLVGYAVAVLTVAAALAALLLMQTRWQASAPVSLLLAAFDLFSDWFRSDGFDGCPFMKVLLEYPPGHPSRRAAAQHLANIREFLKELAAEAGIRNPGLFASTWQILMKGAVVSACEGNLNAAREAKVAAGLYLRSCLAVRAN